jgi:hypothetical protein
MEVVIMTTKGKMFRFGMVGLALILGLAFAGCKQEYEGTSGSGYYNSDGAKTVTVTLKKSSYKVEYAGHSAEGDATRTGIPGVRVWTFTSKGSGGAAQLDRKTLSWVDYTSPDGSWYFEADNLGKKAVDADGNVIDIDDIEVIIIEDEEDD